MSDRALINLAHSRGDNGIFIFTDMYGTEFLRITKNAISKRLDCDDTVRFSAVLLEELLKTVPVKAIFITGEPQPSHWNVLRIEYMSREVLFMKNGWDGLSLAKKLDDTLVIYSFEDFVNADDIVLGSHYEVGKNTLPI